MSELSSNRLASFKEVLTARRSVRGFKNKPLSPSLIEEIFSQAQLSPSNCNTQPWHVHVVSGELCQRFASHFQEAMMAGDISLDFPYEGRYEGAYKDRQYDAAYQLYAAMGIARDDKVKRNEAFFRNFNFFGAPHVAFIFMDEGFGVREAADIGMYAQSLMLSITACGAASCPQTALSFHADYVRSELGIDATKKLLFGISFGYENPDEPANAAKVGRAALAETVTFHQ